MERRRPDELPTIISQDVWVRFFIRYHRSDVTLRETFVRLIDRFRPGRRLEASRETEFWALRGISLTAHAGEVIGLIGRNGSGKTTLLKTLAGICGTDRGLVQVRGSVGCLMSFGVGFKPNLSGRENVYLNGSILGLNRREIDERIGEIIAFSELGDFIDAPVRTYSAGMKGRLGFSIAVHIDPDVLLLDEVLSVGDAAFRARAGSILDRFRGQRKTVVIASHDMDLVRNQCTRVLWLDAGRIHCEGEPNDVIAAYSKAAKGAAQK
jgi:ABC-type polysaccharide/polyol phosphate transport system ATPase subunit